MSVMSRTFTPAEAAAVAGVDVKAVQNAIDKRIVIAHSRPGVIRSKRTLTDLSVLKVKLWKEMGGAFTPERRLALFAEIERQPRAKTVKAGEYLIVDVGAARKDIEKGVRDLALAEAEITTSKAVLGGEPVFKGTRIPVRLVAAMLHSGASEAEILEGYPKLDGRHLPMARVWSAAHPPVGRPKTLADKGGTIRSKVVLKTSSRPSS
jgi:uncharacterized protein (DUF433 family)